MTSANRWLVLAVVSSALLLIVIDMTILYTALPRLTADLGASQSQKLWIVNAYALTAAGLLPAMGALGDRFGARLMFLSGLLVFGAASTLAAFAPGPQVLIAARVLLAVGAAMMMPATLAIIRHTFRDEAERSLAIGIWAAVASGGAAFGPILGGALLEYFWWGSVFLINVPIVLIAFVAGVVLVGRHRSEGGHPFSLIGSVQILIGLVATTLAIKEFGKPAPSLTLALVAAVIGAGFIALFIRGQRRAAHPMLDLRRVHRAVHPWPAARRASDAGSAPVRQSGVQQRRDRGADCGRRADGPVSGDDPAAATGAGDVAAASRAVAAAAAAGVVHFRAGDRAPAVVFLQCKTAAAWTWLHCRGSGPVHGRDQPAHDPDAASGSWAG